MGGLAGLNMFRVMHYRMWERTEKIKIPGNMRGQKVKAAAYPAI
jgi:hypothetical protein